MLLTKNNLIVHTIIDSVNQITSDGVELEKKYKFIYQIESKNGVKPKKLETLKKGSDIIEDVNSMSSYFRSTYDGPSNEFLYHLRHYVKSVVMIHSTIHIKGSGPKVMKQLKQSVSKMMLKSTLREMKKPAWIEFLKCCVGTYMWFKFTEKEAEDNCVIVTDIEKLSPKEIDEFMKNGTRSEMSEKMMTEQQMREILLNGFLKTEWVKIDLDQKRTLH